MLGGRELIPLSARLREMREENVRTTVGKVDRRQEAAENSSSEGQRLTSFGILGE